MKKFFLPLLLISNLCFAQVNLNLGLKAHYPFSGNASDISGSGFHGNPQGGVQLTTDRFGNPNSAYLFDGIDDRIIVTDNGGLSTPAFSIVYYFMTTSTNFQNCIGKINYIDGNAATYNSGIMPGTSKPYFSTLVSLGNCFVQVASTFDYSIFGPDPIQVNQWYCVVNTFENGVEKMYLNGVLVSQGTVPFNNATFCSNTNFVIGSWWQNDPIRFRGKMDDIRFYNRALNEDEVNALCGTVTVDPCHTWLKTQAAGDKVSVGDLDVSGNQITVEASFNKTIPGGPLGGGFLVSKHTTAGNINYALEPEGCAISTVNGNVLLEANCSTQLNKTYHVAMVYDGSSVKFYRNGFLHKQAPLSGNLALNNFIATIGENSPGGGPIYPFSGNINEVRIWNIARTQAQLNTYMNSSLPNPATQTGLLGYYVFNDLANKQGNPVWNGILNGGATINSSNPNCNFIADSCASTPPPVDVGNIINDYTPVLALNPCDNKITVEDASRYNVGDTVLMIQMKGAVIDSTNTAAFGTITDYKNSGNYEFNYIKAKTGNVIELKNKFIKQYDIPTGKVQLIRVPYYNNINVAGTLTCLQWDGSKGGVLVLNVRDTINLQADINVSGKGFRGGNDLVTNPAVFNCNENQYYYPPNPDLASEKGEGIAIISPGKSYGKGALANGGGAGNSHNSGGAGGGNIGTGGFGGYQFEGSPCNTTVPFDNRGISGKSLIFSNALNKVFLGGGGGAGHTNNPEALQSKGGNGAGIVIIIADKLINNSKKIIANGNPGITCGFTYPNCHEGMGGGGAAGTILLQINTYVDNTTLETKGGNGGNMTAATFGRVGPGGGGSGGVVWLTNATVPPNVIITNSGGINGVCTAYANDPWGATAGANGNNLFSLNIPFASVPFTINIDSVRIKDSLLNCNGFDFKGFGYTNTNPIATWQWYFGDGNTANTQNTSHAYGAAGTFNVKLVVTDINGCKDSIAKDVIALPGILADAGIDTAFCSNTPVSVVLHGSGAGTYSWSPPALLNDPALQNPTATVSTTTKFYLTVTGAAACNAIDSVTISINPVPLVQTLIDTSICKNAVLMLGTTAGLASYNWSTGIYVSDSTIANPFFIDTVSRTLIVTGTNSFGCFAKDTIDIFVKPLPVVTTIDDTTICNSSTVTLVTTGAQTYSWSPALFLNDPNIANPVYSGNIRQTYVVTGTAANGCRSTDTVSVNVNAPMVFQAPPDKTMCNTSSVVLDGYNGTSVDYLWSPGTYLSSTTIINPVANPPSTTSYNVLITDRTCNTDSSFAVQVVVGARPLINAGKSNDIDCAHRSATLFASGGTSYSWSPSTGLDNPNIPNPVATPAGTQQYIVTVTDAGGCFDKDTVTVFKDLTASLARYMPNAFTPNGDGINDCYGLKNWVYIKKLQFYIFNRYGEQVFATASPFKCWDGTYKGKQALAGTYVYYIKAETDCGTEEQKGTFLLVR